MKTEYKNRSLSDQSTVHLTDLPCDAHLLVAGQPAIAATVLEMNEYQALIALETDCRLPDRFHVLLPALEIEVFCSTIMRDGRALALSLDKSIEICTHETETAATQRRLADVWSTHRGANSGAGTIPAQPEVRRAEYAPANGQFVKDLTSPASSRRARGHTIIRRLH